MRRGLSGDLPPPLFLQQPGGGLSGLYGHRKPRTLFRRARGGSRSYHRPGGPAPLGGNALHAAPPPGPGGGQGLGSDAPLSGAFPRSAREHPRRRPRSSPHDLQRARGRACLPGAFRGAPSLAHPPLGGDGIRKREGGPAAISDGEGVPQLRGAAAAPRSPFRLRGGKELGGIGFPSSGRPWGLPPRSDAEFLGARRGAPGDGRTKQAIEFSPRRGGGIPVALPPGRYPIGGGESAHSPGHPDRIQAHGGALRPR
ncbi:MAG: hypothetical protein BWY88_00884 [Synergistetes bacterium ADurb.Bin520]|nr:MAG: hypothetical protein BWY88_00884 [Synergistetes bacterium ADurb.Bin520]